MADSWSMMPTAGPLPVMVGELLFFPIPGFGDAEATVALRVSRAAIRCCLTPKLVTQCSDTLGPEQ